MGKKIAVVVAITVVAVVAVQFYLGTLEDDSGYIFDKSHNIRLEDVAGARKSVNFTSGRDASASADADGLTESNKSSSRTIKVDEYFAGDDRFGVVVDSYTLKYFKHLQSMFEDSRDLEGHLQEVKAYLLSQFPREEAARLFEIYEKYLRTEMELAQQQRNWGAPQSAEDVVAMLRRIQEFRREKLGRELADALYGADVKAREYAVRRGSIVGDDTLYGAEKEEMIGRLNEDMWGDEAEAVNTYPKPYNQYREKLEMYKKDLEELPGEALREERIREFREQYFEPEVVERLEDVDRQIAQEDDLEQQYREKEQEILADQEMPEEQKQEAVQRLQEQTFGDQAEAFRRREAMRQDLERRKQQFGENSGP
ncbi:MAG: lipase secretion chaperone [Desulfatibacillaceae bacterium]